MRPKIRRVRAWPVPQRAPQSGMALLYALFAVVLILILGLAFMQTTAIESLVNTHSVQQLQATDASEYGLARARAMGYSQHGFWYAMTYNGNPLTWATSASYGGHSICTLFSSQPVPSIPLATYKVVIEDLSGFVSLSGQYRIHSYGTVGNCTRHLSVDATALTFGSFGWLTNSENGVWFRTGDSLGGLIWTNGQFNITGNPVFNGPVYQAGASSLHYMNGGPPNDNPTFAKGIEYSPQVQPLNISSVMSGNNITAVATAANQSGGILLPSNSNGYSLTFNSGGTFTIYQLDSSGDQVSPALYNNQAVSTTNGAFYFQSPVKVSGTLAGSVTIATSSGNDIDIVGNLVYSSFPAPIATTFSSGFNPSVLTDKCALISGGNVVVYPATWSTTLTKPKTGSSYYAYSTSWSNAGTNMYITATVASVTGSFKNQYYTSSPQKTLNVYGGIAQSTRDAIGTTGGAGFLKNYIYDTRFSASPPPFLLQASLGDQFTNWVNWGIN